MAGAIRPSAVHFTPPPLLRGTSPRETEGGVGCDRQAGCTYTVLIARCNCPEVMACKVGVFENSSYPPNLRVLY
jgi:hypothetical protein